MTSTNVRDRIRDLVDQAGAAAHEARHFGTVASEAADDGARAARQLRTRMTHRIEDLRAAAGYRVRRAPLASLAMAAGAGLLLGALLERGRRYACRVPDRS